MSKLLPGSNKPVIGAAQNLMYLIEASKLLNSTLDSNKIIQVTVKLTTQALQAEASCLFLFDSKKQWGGNLNRFFSWKREAKEFYNKDLSEQLALKILKEARPFLSNAFVEYAQTIPHRQDHSRKAIHSVVAVPLRRHKTILGVLQAINKLDGGRFSDDDLAMLQALADLVAIAIDNARLYKRLRKESREKQILYELGKKISSSLDLDEVLNTILDSALEVVAYDAAGIYLVKPGTQTIRHQTVRGYDEEVEAKTPLKVGEGIIGWTVKTGKGIIVPDVSKDSRYIQVRPETRSEMAVPIISNGTVIGAFNVESDHLDAYNGDTLKMLEAFSSQAAISIEMATLHQERLERKRIEEELAISRRIQQSFLPARNPDLAGFDVAGINIPSGEVSGDYYDFIKITDSDWGIVIGDVVGKGIPASLIMASFRAGLIAEIRNNYSIRVILSKVSNLLHESLQPNEFVTAFYGVLNLGNWTFTYTNAGHNYPLLRRSGGKYEFLTEGGLPLGLFADTSYEERIIGLGSGDVMVLYTDGLVEAMDGGGGEFGVGRLTEIVERAHELTAQAILDKIQCSLARFQEGDGPAALSGSQHQDDITIVVVKAK
jgi:sigma-B regulation protein RsbU (phosphoserine phosphatase)